MRLGDVDQLGKVILAERLVRPDVLPVVKKLARDKDEAFPEGASMDLPQTLGLDIFEVKP